MEEKNQEISDIILDEDFTRKISIVFLICNKNEYN